MDACGREMVCSQKSVRNRNSLKMQDMYPFLFVKLVQQRRTQNHAKPAHRVRRSSGQPFTGTTRSAGVGGSGLALAILVGLANNSDIDWVGEKMVLRRIAIYFLKKNQNVSRPSEHPPVRGRGVNHFSRPKA